MSVLSAFNPLSGALLGAPLHDATGLIDTFEYVEPFLQRPQANASIGVATNLDWELLGTNTPTAALNAGGGITLGTDTNAADQAIVWPHQDSAQTLINALAWDLNLPVVYDVLLVPTAVAAQTLYAGFKLTAVLDLTTDANAVFFYAAIGGAWQIATSIGGTDALVDTGIAPAAGVPQRLTMVSGFAQNGAAVASFYIDGQQVAGPVAVPTVTTGLKPFVGCQGNAQTTAVRAIRLMRRYGV